MKTSLFLVVASALSVAIPQLGQAAGLSVVGTLTGVAGDDNDQIDSWRSTSVAKTLDLDGNNVYGSAGYVAFAVDDASNTTAGTAPGNVDPFSFSSLTRRSLMSLPSYITLASVDTATTGVASSYGYKLIDNPSLSPAATVANVESGAALKNTNIGTEGAFFDLTIGAGAPSTIRLGLLYGNTDTYDGTFRVAQTVGGSTSVTVNQSVSAPLQMAFFDITNATAGEVFRIYGTKIANGNANNNALLGGITFDAIPEPSAMLLGGLGLSLAGLRRRRHKGARPPRLCCTTGSQPVRLHQMPIHRSSHQEVTRGADVVGNLS